MPTQSAIYAEIRLRTMLESVWVARTRTCTTSDVPSDARAAAMIIACCTAGRISVKNRTLICPITPTQTLQMEQEEQRRAQQDHRRMPWPENATLTQMQRTRIRAARAHRYITRLIGQSCWSRLRLSTMWSHIRVKKAGATGQVKELQFASSCARHC